MWAATIASVEGERTPREGLHLLRVQRPVPVKL